MFEFFLCLFVIFIHVSSETVTYGDPAKAFTAVLFFCNRALSFVVPAFIFSSALKLTLKYKERRFTSEYFSGRITKIYLPYLFWVAVYYAYFIYIGWETPDLRTLAMYAWDGTLAAHFYFVVIIMQFYILMPFLLWLAKKIPAFLGLAAAIVLTFAYRSLFPYEAGIFSFLPGDRWAAAYLIYWFMGIYCALNFEAFNNFLNRHRASVYLSCAGFASAHLLLQYANLTGAYNYGGYFETAQIIYCAMLTCGFYTLCIPRRAARESGESPPSEAPSRLGNFFGRAGAVTYYVYLSHVLVLLAVQSYLLHPWEALAYKFAVKAAVVYAVPFIGAGIYVWAKGKILKK